MSNSEDTIAVIEIDGQQVEFSEGKTILECAKKMGTFIPTLCFLRTKEHRSVCRLCVVEIEGIGNRLMPSCSTPATKGMRVKTDSLRVQSARETVMEMILAEHGSSDQGDKIWELAEKIGVRETAVEVQRNPENSAIVTSGYLNLDPRLCVKCDRCVRACMKDIIYPTGRASNRGYGFQSEVDEDHSPCVQCGDCIAACPAGAITLVAGAKDAPGHVKFLLNAVGLSGAVTSPSKEITGE